MGALEGLELADRVGVLSGLHVDQAVAIGARARLRTVARGRQLLVDRPLPSGHRRDRRWSCWRRRLTLLGGERRARSARGGTRRRRFRNTWSTRRNGRARDHWRSGSGRVHLRLQLGYAVLERGGLLGAAALWAGMLQFGHAVVELAQLLLQLATLRPIVL